MATLLLWLAFIAAVLGVIAAYATRSPWFVRVPWVALALALFFASLLVAGGAIDLDT